MQNDETCDDVRFARTGSSFFIYSKVGTGPGSWRAWEEPRCCLKTMKGSYFRVRPYDLCEFMTTLLVFSLLSSTLGHLTELTFMLQLSSIMLQRMSL